MLGLNSGCAHVLHQGAHYWRKQKKEGGSVGGISLVKGKEGKMREAL